ncbi:MAG TPA: putative dsRNA-binding protein, partial [Verrucomicrobiae bacterium]
RGFDAAQKFVKNEFAADFNTLPEPPVIENPKGELQELLQAKSPNAPLYQVIATSGADHDRHFECAVSHEGIELARGSGKSKKAAESEAALIALQKLRAESTAAKNPSSEPGN